MDIVDTLAEPKRYSWAVDWLTLTWPAGSRMYNLIKRKFKSTLHGLDGTPEGQGVLEPVKRLGYVGWRLNKWFIGWRADSAILIVTSYSAAQFLHIPHIDEARCTRIDIKCDLHYDYPRPYILDNARSLSLLAQTGIRGRKWNVELHQPTERPHWLEVGRRGAGIYLRIYDKWEESGRDPAYEGVWRLEAEIAKEHANEAFHWLVSRGGTGRAVADVGLAYFARRGIRLAGTRPSEWFDILVPSRPDDDASRTLAWLHKLVRPAVRKLLTYVDKADIMEALELFDVDLCKGCADGKRDRREHDSQASAQGGEAGEET